PVLPRLSLYTADPPPALHPFPTRRSSDLRARVALRRRGRHVARDVGLLAVILHGLLLQPRVERDHHRPVGRGHRDLVGAHERRGDRKSTRLNSSHDQISYAVFCLKKKKK